MTARQPGAPMPATLRALIHSSVAHPARQVPCPHCHALAGKPCTLRTTGRHLPQPHPRRVSAWAQQTACCPECQVERGTFTVQVRYQGGGLFAVKHGIRYYGTDGKWSYEPSFGEDDDAADAWWAPRTFDHDTALKLARDVASTLTYRGRTVADALAEEATS